MLQICGKDNPTNLPGYGYAFRAIECLRVLAPPGLTVVPGPCFIRCSSGVNAKLVLPVGRTKEIERNGRRLTDGTPYFRLNSIADARTLSLAVAGRGYTREIAGCLHNGQVLRCFSHGCKQSA